MPSTSSLDRYAVDVPGPPVPPDHRPPAGSEPNMMPPPSGQRSSACEIGRSASPRCTTDSAKPTTSTRYSSAASASRKDSDGHTPGWVFVDVVMDEGWSCSP